MSQLLSRVIVWSMVVGVASAHALSAAPQEPASPCRPIVGAIRWDAWYGQGTPVNGNDRFRCGVSVCGWCRL
jgi:hypothetical protein